MGHELLDAVAFLQHPNGRVVGAQRVERQKGYSPVSAVTALLMLEEGSGENEIPA